MYGLKQPEIIINQIEDFNKKLDYCKRTYNYDLTLKGFNEARIVEFAYGDSLQEVQEGLDCI